METLLTVAEAAERAKVSRVTIFRAMTDGRLPFVERYGKRLAKPGDVDKCAFGTYGGIARARIPRGPKKGAKAGT